MALLRDKLQELLPLFPKSDRKKLEAVYQKIPGSLLKFIDPIQMTMKVECREQNLQVDSSMFMTHSESPIYHASSAPTSPIRNKPVNHGSSWGYDDFGQQNQGDSYLTTVSISPNDPYRPVLEPNKYKNPLKKFLLQSITKKFHEKSITMVSPTTIVEDIISNCFTQCPDWGRYRCEQPSVIIRFNNSHFNQTTTEKMNTNVYVYAFLEFQYNQSILLFKKSQEPRISFEVTIELNSIMIDSQKLMRTSAVLNSSNQLEDVLKKIESVSSVNWNDLDRKREKEFSSSPPYQQSSTSQPKLSWDDL